MSISGANGCAVAILDSSIGTDRISRCRALAEDLGQPLLTLDEVGGPLCLVDTGERLELRQLGKKAPGPVAVDFVQGKNAHRRQFGGGRGQPLARAVGLKQGRNPTVCDTTAGLGQDSFVLATLGCELTLVERSPFIAALLDDGLERAGEDPEIAPIVHRMQLLKGDAITLLTALKGAERPDVIYMDPMYPHREKSARVKKEMRLFQALVGEDSDSAELLQVARGVALNRVVVKRPAKAEPVGGQKPSMVIKSPNTRYDVYLSG
ncbi:MAG: class I SAM-dependent methyltransferase [Gammaproteobacteria bacterium]|nr:class I SAM-dependent methyltransferase [Gammaproteobacteria bacterium]